jgi:hypothetical protein
MPLNNKHLFLISPELGNKFILISINAKRINGPRQHVERQAPHGGRRIELPSPRRLSAA